MSPLSIILVVCATESELRRGSFVMMFTTPPMAFEPKSAEPPPRITSTRSIIATGSCSRPYTVASELKMGFESSRICEYCPSRPFMRNCTTPQFPQVFSTRRPGWNAIDSARFDDAVFSKSFADATFTIVAVLFLLVSLRVADTTTSSIVIVSSSIEKFTSIVLLAVITNFCSMVFRPTASATIVHSPRGRFFRKK